MATGTLGKPLIKIANGFKEEITATANTVTDINIPVSLSGYTLIGLVGVRIGSGGNSVGLVSAMATGQNNAYIRIINNSSSTKTGIDITVAGLLLRD